MVGSGHPFEYYSYGNLKAVVIIATSFLLLSKETFPRRDPLQPKLLSSF